MKFYLYNLKNFLETKNKIPSNLIVTISYEDLITNPEVIYYKIKMFDLIKKSLRELCKQIDLPLNETELKKIKSNPRMEVLDKDIQNIEKSLKNRVDKLRKQ